MCYTTDNFPSKENAPWRRSSWLLSVHDRPVFQLDGLHRGTGVGVRPGVRGLSPRHLVFVPLALSMGVTAPVIIAAVMSGIGLGYSTCFYADAVFMTTAGTGVSNITIIKTTLPYAAGAAAVAAAGFLLCGILA